MTESDLLILGAGPAGLAHAFWALRNSNRRQVNVLERSASPGGWARSLEVRGHHLELGPQALRPDESLLDTLLALGLESRIVAPSEKASRRFVARGGRLRALPSGPAGLLTTGLFSLAGKFRLLREPSRRPRAAGDPENGSDAVEATESVAEFVHRRFGPEAARLASAMVHGIFAGDADELEACSAFPVLTEGEREYGSVLKAMKAKARARRSDPSPRPPALLSFEGGMQALTDRLHKRLGDLVTLGVEPLRIHSERGRFRVDLDSGAQWSAANLVLATPANATARLLRNLDSELADELEQIPFMDVVSVYVSVPADSVEARGEGFGCLFEPGEPGPVLGILYASSVFPAHAPRDRALFRVMLGGAREPEIRSWSLERVVEAALDALQTYPKLAGPFEILHTETCLDAIPQYVKGHSARVRRIRRRLETQHPGLELIGNSYDAIALPPQLRRPEHRGG